MGHRSHASYDQKLLNAHHSVGRCTRKSPFMTQANTLALAGVAQWIECRLRTKGLQVQFPVRAHAWVTGQVPSRGCRSATILFSPSLSPSLPLCLKINKILKKKKWANTLKESSEKKKITEAKYSLSQQRQLVRWYRWVPRILTQQGKPVLQGACTPEDNSRFFGPP